MKLTVLGRYGLYPPRGGACSSFLVSLACGANILLDCGPGALTRRPEDMLNQMDVLVLSHLHWDHVSDALPLRYALERMGKKIDVFLPAEPASIAQFLTESQSVTPRYVADGMRYDGGGFTMEFFSMRHPVPACGVRVEEENASLAYSGDTNTCESLPTLLSGADIALVDACLSDAQWDDGKPHLSARLAAQALRDADVRIPLLTHLPPDADEYALLREARQARPDALFAVEGRIYDTHA